MRLILFSLGVWSVTTPVIRRQLGRGAEKDDGPGKQDFVVVNRGSLLDVLFLEWALSPVFVGEKELLGVGKWVKRTNEVDVRNWKRGPIAVFGEGCRSNGKGVLKFVRGVPNEVEGDVYVCGIGYSAEKKECWTLGGAFGEMLRLMGRLSNRIDARMAKSSGRSASELQKDVAAMAKVPCLNVGTKEWEQFQQHWKATRKGYKG